MTGFRLKVLSRVGYVELIEVWVLTAEGKDSKEVDRRKAKPGCLEFLNTILRRFVKDSTSTHLDK